MGKTGESNREEIPVNYYRALKRKSDGKYEFTCRNDNHIWAIGYCGGWKEYAEEDFTRVTGLKEWVGRNVHLKDKFHTSGHNTIEEAVECYRQYALDVYLVLPVKDEAGGKCVLCNESTQLAAEIPPLYRFWYLCPKHLTRQQVEKLFHLDEFMGT